jgi:hypothetical protein
VATAVAVHIQSRARGDRRTGVPASFVFPVQYWPILGGAGTGNRFFSNFLIFAVLEGSWLLLVHSLDSDLYSTWNTEDQILPHLHYQHLQGTQPTGSLSTAIGLIATILAFARVIPATTDNIFEVI